MPYFVSSIIAVVSAMIIMFTRYEGDDSSITAELESVKSMFSTINGFVNTYIETGGNLTEINFQKLSCDGILLGNIKDTVVVTDCAKTNTADGTTDNVLGFANASTLNFPKSKVKWQIIPVRDITAEAETVDFASSAGNAYKILVDMSANASLMAKSKFAESFASREFCEKMLFGTVQEKRKTYEAPSSGQENFKEDGTDRDGIFVCIVFK